MNACYVLTSGGPANDQLCEMTYVSVSLLLRLYPDCQVTVLVDEQTARQVASLPFQFCELATVKIEPIDPQLQGNAVRSRYLKTRMRNLVGGDFIFLDADALALKPFDEVFTLGVDFAAALDRNREFPEPRFPNWVVPIYERYNWPRPIPRYYNSGVMFMADSHEMHQMAELWHRRWRTAYDELGVHQDQPSLNHTLNELDVSQKELPAPYNAMVDASPYLSRGAKIVHYFLRGEGREPDPLSLLSHLVGHLRDTNEIDWPAVEAAAKNSDAWVHPTNSIRIELATRNYLRAIGIAATRAFQRP